MKSRIAFLFLMLLTVSQVACSKQWRENKVAISSEEVFAQLDQVSAMNMGGGYQDFLNLAYDPNTTVFYAESSALSPVPVIASIFDFSFMYDAFGLADVQNIKVFFLDFKDGDYRDNALMIVADLYAGGQSMDIFWGQGTVGGGQFVADMVSDDGAAGITLKSFDITKSGDFNGTIQLKTYLYPDSYIGKFSTLVGYR